MHDDFQTHFVKWEEHFMLGIPSIDNAHEEMFRIMNRVHKLIHIGGNLKWTATEAIKFFKSYAINHFEDEEAFMIRVGYVKYAEHKKVHDGMRDKIIPRLHSHLEHTNYSEDAVLQFLRVWNKWLSKHILGHDRDLVTWVESDQ